MECVAELHGLLQPELQHALLYGALRQHALALRSAQGYSWALLLSLRATVRAVSRASALQPLVYPAAHVVSGFLQLSSSPSWLPAQLLLLDLLLLLAPRAYVPVAAAAVRLLSALLTAAPASSGGSRAAPALPATALRAPKAALAGRGPVREALAGRLLGVVGRAAAQVARHASFPEWAAPLTRQLRYLGRYAGPRQGRQLAALAAALERNTRHVLAARAALQLTPHSGAAAAAEALAQRSEPFPLESYLAGLPQQPGDFLERVLDEAELVGLDTAGGGEEGEEGERMEEEESDSDNANEGNGNEDESSSGGE